MKVQEWQPATPAESMTLAVATGAPPSQQRTMCRECGKVLLQKTLQRHIDTHHNREVTFRCQGCSKSFRRKDHLARHFREKHSDESDTVDCVHCGKQVRQRYLYEHWKGQKCLSAQDSRNDALQHMGTQSMVDPLVMSGALLYLAMWIRAVCLNRSEASASIEPNLVPRKLYHDAFELRAYALHQTNNLLSQTISTKSNKCLYFTLIARISNLLWVDKALFGENSAEYETHRHALAERIRLKYETHPHALKERTTYYSKFILEYEALSEHSLCRVQKNTVYPYPGT